jgi:hypothetical protein
MYFTYIYYYKNKHGVFSMPMQSIYIVNEKQEVSAEIIKQIQSPKKLGGLDF